MNGVSQDRLVVERKIRALEDETAERLESIRVLDEQWDDYRRVMRDHAAVFEQAGVAMGAENYFVQKALTARRELDRYVGQLVHEQAELFEEMAQGVRSASEAELERLQLGKADT
jgi:hypothetical protein